MFVALLVAQSQIGQNQEQAGGMGQRVQAAGGNRDQAGKHFQNAAGGEEVFAQNLQRQPQVAGGGARNTGDDGGRENALQI